MLTFEQFITEMEYNKQQKKTISRAYKAGDEKGHLDRGGVPRQGMYRDNQQRNVKAAKARGANSGVATKDVDRVKRAAAAKSKPNTGLDAHMHHAGPSRMTRMPKSARGADMGRTNRTTRDPKRLPK